MRKLHLSPELEQILTQLADLALKGSGFAANALVNKLIEHVSKAEVVEEAPKADRVVVPDKIEMQNPY